MIELLVVIAIVAVLVSVLLPSLAGARQAARQAVELAAAQQLHTAFALYANDSRDAVLPGYPPRALIEGPIVVRDQAGQRLTGEVAQRYPWRLAPYLDYNLRGLYQSVPLLNQLIEGDPQYAGLGIDGRYLVSLFPSMGMNVAFVGGSDRHLGFSAANQNLFGPFYVTRMDQPRRPSNLIVWASAREGVQSWAPQLGRPEGFFRVEPPWFSGRNWASAYDPAASAPGSNSGFVSLRYKNKAVVGMFDGHAESLGWDQLQDMRRWCDLADTPEWTLRRR